MPQVSVTINGRQFRMACEEGEEPNLLRLAADLDGELTVAVEGVMGRLIGSLPRSSRFLTQTRRSLVHQPAP